MQRISAVALRKVYEEGGPKALVHFVRTRLEASKNKDSKDGIRPEQFSLRDLAMACGVFSPYDSLDAAASSVKGVIGRFEAIADQDPDLTVQLSHAKWESTRGNALYSQEAALTTSIFPIVTGQLLSQMIIDGYEQAPAISDQLVTTLSGQRLRNQKIAGFTSLGGPLEVAELGPYSDTGFTEKYVVTSETKKGRTLSVSEELIMFDQTSEVMRRANMLGEMVRQDRERSIVRAVCDADSGSGVYVWRPSGTGATLYATDGTNSNYIGSGSSTSGYDAQKVLTDWTTLDHVRKYRATQVKDDRVDGTQRAIGMINTGLTLLVPESLRGVADSIVNATVTWSEGATTSAHYGAQYGNPVRGLIANVLSSPYVDEINTADYYVGQFKKQFIYTEIWPVQTFLQGSNSESAFNNDVAFRVKVRYYGGISAVDKIYVTKVDG